MMTIFYEALPVSSLTFDGRRLDYDPSWEARNPALPISLMCRF